jgi:hypothetical protein
VARICPVSATRRSVSGSPLAFGERQHVLGGVFWHCARHATSTPDCRARSFINALSRDGHCREPRIERKTKDVCHRRRRRSHRVQKPRRRPVPPTSHRRRWTRPLRHRACSRTADGRLAGRPHASGYIVREPE